MRLIDADTIPYLYPMDDDGNEGDGMTLKSTIDEIPTVKAIPIEVLEQIKTEIETEMEFFPDGETYISADMVLNIIDKAIKEQKT